MKKILIFCLPVLFLVYGQSIEIIDKNPDCCKRKTPQTDKTEQHGFPTQVKMHPSVTIRAGKPPTLPILEVEKLRENLLPLTAKHVENLSFRKIEGITELIYSKAEMLASYEAMVQKQLAEIELKYMVKNGASDNEIEAFKTATDERILQIRYGIMKAIGTAEEIKKTEEAILKFNLYKNQREEK